MVKHSIQIPFFLEKILSFLLIIIGWNNANAQESWQFVSDNSRYIEKEIILEQMSDPGVTNYYDYLIKGDTVIEAEHYQIVNGRNIGRQPGNGPDIVYNLTDYITIGAIRKDTTKVFFRSFGNIDETYFFSDVVNTFVPNEDQFIYDFSAEVGDSLAWKLGFQNTIDAIDTFQLNNGEEVRRYIFVLEPFFAVVNDYWLEGVGSYRGLLGARTPVSTNPRGPHYNLACVITLDSGEPIYSLTNDINAQCLQLPTQTKEERVKNPISIYPNPTTGSLNIKMPESFDQLYSIKIVDGLGRTILYERDLNSKLISYGLEFKPGFYYLSVFSKHRVIHSQLLIIE